MHKQKMKPVHPYLNTVPIHLSNLPKYLRTFLNDPFLILIILDVIHMLSLILLLTRASDSHRKLNLFEAVFLHKFLQQHRNHQNV